MLSRRGVKRIGKILIVAGVILLVSVASGEDLATAQERATACWPMLVQSLLGVVSIWTGLQLLGGESDE